jgi:hypothetical protein
MTFHGPTVRPDLPFTCNVCGQRSLFQTAHYFNPEEPSCGECQSNVRMRWLVHRLSLELFDRSILLPEFPCEKTIIGLGLTDPEPIAAGLARRLTYLNTYLTNEPRLNIRFDPSPLGELDFLIASEVFEHVEPPVIEAFHNSARLLKDSGVLLLTTPWVWDGDPAAAIPELFDWKLDREEKSWVIENRKPDGQVERFADMSFDGTPGASLGHTREHFPALSDWKLSNEDGIRELTNVLSDGTAETFSNLVFHSGPGLALEMRLFTRGGIENSLRAAGFRQIDFEVEDTPEFGIVFGYPWSRPITARK